MKDQQNVPPTYKRIKEAAKKCRLNINQLCELAGVERSRLTRWAKKEHPAFEALRRIEAVLEQKAKEIMAQVEAMAETRPK